jgi:hypothetical protein
VVPCDDRLKSFDDRFMPNSGFYLEEDAEVDLLEPVEIVPVSHAVDVLDGNVPVGGTYQKILDFLVGARGIGVKFAVTRAGKAGNIQVDIGHGASFLSSLLTAYRSALHGALGLLRLTATGCDGGFVQDFWFLERQFTGYGRLSLFE